MDFKNSLVYESPEHIKTSTITVYKEHIVLYFVIRKK